MTSRFSLIQSQFPCFVGCSTDACPVNGGGFFRGYWFYINWAADYPCLTNAHINLQVTFIALAALLSNGNMTFSPWHFRLTARHTSSASNTIADSISPFTTLKKTLDFCYDISSKSVKSKRRMAARTLETKRKMFYSSFSSFSFVRARRTTKKGRCSKSLLGFEPAL